MPLRKPGRAPRRRRFAFLSAASAAAAVALPIALPGGGPGGGGPPPVSQMPPPSQQATGRLFSPTSFWNAPLPANAAVDPESHALVAALSSEVAEESSVGRGPWIQTDEATTPLYTVPPDQPTVRVHLDARAGAWNASLRKALAAVPIPPGAQPAPGRDADLTVWQPSTDKLWEFWRARRAWDGWHADFGGAMQNVSQSPGYYGPWAWPGAGYNWGATATSLPVIGGTMLPQEIASGHIDHVLAFDVPNARFRSFSWPAQRSDGTGPLSMLPEGARLRLDPRVDVASLGLTPLGEMMAKAAQRYGIVVRDRTHHSVGFFAQDVVGSDPYHGPGGFFRGKTPAKVLARFPWSRLQVLKMSKCSGAPCGRGSSP